jgi:hypothetical protein
LFVSDGNFLEDSFEATAYRELCRALAGQGVPCEVVCRFVTAGEQEIAPGVWLADRGLTPGADPGPGEPVGFRLPPELRDTTLRVSAPGVPVTLFVGPSTKPHVPDDAEQAAFLNLVTAALDRGGAEVVLVRSGPCLADVLAAAHSRQRATVALQPDSTPREADPFREADVVLAPARCTADYLREALGLPCAHLAPILAAAQVKAEPGGPGAVVFDGSPGNGLGVIGQIAEEIRRRRPDIPLLVLGKEGAVPLPGGGSIPGADDRVPSGARVCVAPLVSWEQLPWAALAALGHGIPVLASDRGAGPEFFDGAGLVLALPERHTAASPSPLLPAELAPWVETILRLCDDPAFAARQRSAALLAGQHWAPAQQAQQYVRFLTGLVNRRRAREPLNGAAAERNGPAGVRRLAAAHAWPRQRPADSAPAEEQGWLGGGTEMMLARSLSPATRVVVELGAWLGLSSRYIADHAPGATVLSIDHWQGSPDHQEQERYKKLLPRLYESFLARCWDYRERIVPLRMKTLDGLRAVADAGLQPDFIYVDAENSFEAVTTELSLARQLWPGMALGGEDYDWQGVRVAVDSFARRHGLIVERFGARGWRLLEGWQAADATPPPPGRGQSVVLVPHLSGIDWECEQALRQLEALGVNVVRRGGCSAIDVARNELLSNALHDGAEAILFIDSDIGFEPADALRLLARPEGVVSGVYAKKGMRELASIFVDGTKEVLFGPDAPGLYPLKYAATGFLRVRAGVLRRLIAELRLPLCNTHWGRGLWPFCQPMIVPQGTDKLHYLGEDWAFSYRLGQIGVTPLADTSIRLWHWGRYSFSWEDAGSTVQRYRSYNYRFD